jgi:hypothetical protein
MNKTNTVDKVNEPIAPEPHDRSAISLEQRGSGRLVSKKYEAVGGRGGGKAHQVTLNMGLMLLAT